MPGREGEPPGPSGDRWARAPWLTSHLGPQSVSETPQECAAACPPPVPRLCLQETAERN